MTCHRVGTLNDREKISEDGDNQGNCLTHSAPEEK